MLSKLGRQMSLASRVKTARLFQILERKPTNKKKILYEMLS